MKTRSARKSPRRDRHRIQILTIEEEEGGFSTIALNLPGAGSCGETKDESITNAKEAIKAVLEVYKDSGDPIPWKNLAETEIDGEPVKVIFVHV